MLNYGKYMANTHLWNSLTDYTSTLFRKNRIFITPNEMDGNYMK